MSSCPRKPLAQLDPLYGAELSPSEEDCHREHAAALDATVFSRPYTDELVFELEGGRLLLRAQST